MNANMLMVKWVDTRETIRLVGAGRIIFVLWFYAFVNVLFTVRSVLYC